MTFAHVVDVMAAAPIGFLVGCAVGFVASNRWKIIRRNGGGVG